MSNFDCLPGRAGGYPGGFAPNRGVALAMRQPGLLRIEPRLKRFSFPPPEEFPTYCHSQSILQ